MKIIKAAASNIEEIVNFRMNSNYDRPKKKNDVKKTIERSLKFSEIYLVNDKNLIAYFVITNKKDITYINYIEVSQKNRKKGLGTKILEECEKLAKKNKSRSLQLAVYSKNQKAIGLYNKMGFYFIRFKRNTHPILGRKLVMEKELK